MPLLSLAAWRDSISDMFTGRSAQPSTTAGHSGSPDVLLRPDASSPPLGAAHRNMIAFERGWMCLANFAQTSPCLADLPPHLCSQNSSLSLQQCVSACEQRPQCLMAVHNRPTRLGGRVAGCWLKAELSTMQPENADYQSYTCVQLSRSHHEHIARRKPGICTAAITPADVSPVRSPQAVHDAIAAALARSRKNVLEIGSRNGDGVSCFAQAAKAAAVIEGASSYCRSLEKRAATLRHREKKDFAIECGFFPAACSAQPLLCSHADAFTWWMLGGEQHLDI